MLDTVRIALGRPARRGTHHECRHCGTTVARNEAECPACESTEFATYEL